MLRSKNIEIFKSLSSSEMREAGAFVRSPFFNRNRNLIKLYDTIKPFYPAFDDIRFTNEFVYKKIFSPKKYNDSIMKNLMSDMYKLMEEFLIQIRLKDKTEKPNKDILLLTKLFENKCNDIFLKKLNEAELLFSNTKIGYYYFLNEFGLLSEKIAYFLSINQQHKIVFDALRKGECRILNLLISLPEIINDIKVNETSFNPDYGFKLSEEFFKAFDYERFINNVKSKHPDHELIDLFYHEFMMFYKPYPGNIRHSIDFKKSLIKHFDIFEKDYLYLLCFALKNFYRDHEQYENIDKELFELYEFMIERKLIIGYDGFIPVADFYPIVRIALDLGKIEWAENFVRNYIDSVNPELKESVFNYSMARISFAKHDFDKVLSYCQNVSFDYLYNKLNVKRLQLQVYYELEYSEQFYSLIEAFRKMLANTEMLHVREKKYQKGFIKFSNKLMQVKNKHKRGSEDIFSIRDEILDFSKSDFLPEKEWLLKKIEELDAD